MPRFLVSIHHRDDYDALAVEDATMRQAIDDLNDEMVAAGVRLFVGGLHHSSEAQSLIPGTGAVEVRPGAYLSTREHVAGFWVLELGAMADALEWGRRAVIACRAPVEVRQFH